MGFHLAYRLGLEHRRRQPCLEDLVDRQPRMDQRYRCNPVYPRYLRHLGFPEDLEYRLVRRILTNRLDLLHLSRRIGPIYLVNRICLICLGYLPVQLNLVYLECQCNPEVLASLARLFPHDNCHTQKSSCFDHPESGIQVWLGLH